jgi:hypothetical protein
VADISDVAMEPHHVISTRISTTESEGSTGPIYESVDDSSYAGIPSQPLAQAGE